MAITNQIVPETLPGSTASKMVEVGGFHTVGEVVMTGTILTFCFFCFMFLYLIVKSDRANPFVLRVYVITIVILGTLLVVSSSYAAEQIAPIVGLFGTIAGYVLGRGERDSGPKVD